MPPKPKSLILLQQFLKNPEPLIATSMKKGIHPKLYDVVFVDTSCDAQFITTSTKKSDETVKIDGKEYFVLKIEVSSLSHPFYTGKRTLLDTAGRADKFTAKMKKAAELKEAKAQKKKKAVEDDDDMTLPQKEEKPKATKKTAAKEPKTEKAATPKKPAKKKA